MVMPTIEPTHGAAMDTQVDQLRSDALSAPRKLKMTIADINGLGDLLLNDPLTSETSMRTMTIPIRMAVLSLVPNQSIANSLSQRGVRSINELPTASIGDATLPSAATIIPVVTARAPEIIPTRLEIFRLGVRCKVVTTWGALGSISRSVESGEMLSLIPSQYVTTKSEYVGSRRSYCCN